MDEIDEREVVGVACPGRVGIFESGGGEVEVAVSVTNPFPYKGVLSLT